MSGTSEGAKKAVAKILARDPDHFRKAGQKGGSVRSDKPRGFAYMAENDREAFLKASAKGGKNGRRTKGTDA